MNEIASGASVSGQLIAPSSVRVPSGFSRDSRSEVWRALTVSSYLKQRSLCVVCRPPVVAFATPQGEFHMLKNLISLSLLAAVSVGCAHGQRSYIDATTGMAPEASALWSRPQEVGYTLGERITGEASRTCILLFICWGAEDGGAGAAIASVIGAITGSSAPSDPLVRAAAAGAVLGSAQETDGIWVLNHETDSFDIFIFTRKSARVIGKAVRLHPIGEVSQERADKVRMLKAASGSNIHLQGASLGL